MRSATSQLTVVAKVVAKKEYVDHIIPGLLKLIAPTRKETGCIEYNLHQDNNLPEAIIFYETGENAASLEQHMNSDHLKDHINAVDGMLEDNAVHFMTRIA
jgi:quinol monooxygenase YgiN